MRLTSAPLRRQWGLWAAQGRQGQPRRQAPTGQPPAAASIDRLTDCSSRPAATAMAAIGPTRAQAARPKAKQPARGVRSSNDSLTYPLNDSAVQLALDNHGIDDSADVVDGRVVDELHDAGIEVDFYFGDVAASGMPSQ
jgi:hypothetical protein